MYSTLKKTVQATLKTNSRNNHTIPSVTSPPYKNSIMKCYAFGLLQQNETSPPPSLSRLSTFGGKSLAHQSIKDALFKENVDSFQSAFVYEFPSLSNALRWSKEVAKNQEQATHAVDNGPIVIMEDEEFGEALSGYSIFFIKVLDKEKFAQYNPSQSLEPYNHKRVATPIAKAPGSNENAKAFDAAVLIAFDSAEDGKAWLESKEYRFPHGELRLQSTSGHGVIIA